VCIDGAWVDAVAVGMPAGFIAAVAMPAGGIAAVGVPVGPAPVPP
jgi:hypothetical protein